MPLDLVGLHRVTLPLVLGDLNNKPITRLSCHDMVNLLHQHTNKKHISLPTQARYHHTLSWDVGVERQRHPRPINQINLHNILSIVISIQSDNITHPFNSHQRRLSVDTTEIKYTKPLHTPLYNPLTFCEVGYQVRVIDHRITP